MKCDRFYRRTGETSMPPFSRNIRHYLQCVKINSDNTIYSVDQRDPLCFGGLSSACRYLYISYIWSQFNKDRDSGNFCNPFSNHLAIFGHLSNSCPHTRSEEHTSELQSLRHLVCRLLLEKK